jgi:hypothetical protein
MHNLKLITPDECIGKTVKNVELDGGMLVLFTDGSLLQLDAVGDEDSADITYDLENEPCDWRLVKIGLMTQEEADTAAKAREIDWQAQSKQRRHEEYLRLKTEFEAPQESLEDSE